MMTEVLQKNIKKKNKFRRVLLYNMLRMCKKTKGPFLLVLPPNATKLPRQRAWSSSAALINCLVDIMERNLQLCFVTVGVTIGPLVCNIADMMFLIVISDLPLS